jgi:hypothetical protein
MVMEQKRMSLWQLNIIVWPTSKAMVSWGTLGFGNQNMTAHNALTQKKKYLLSSDK